MGRRKSPKGLKDRVDILSLLLNTRFNVELYRKLIRKHGLENFEKRLKEIVIKQEKSLDT